MMWRNLVVLAADADRFPLARKLAVRGLNFRC